MRKWFGAATAAFFAVGASMLPVQASMDNQPLVSVCHDGIRFPESVYPYDGGLFISNFGSDTMNPRPDENKGYILYRKDGATKIVVPADGGLHKPTAMAVKDGYLFVCDETRLVVYSLEKPQDAPQIVTFAPEDQVVNDIALDGDTLYITVTNTGRIYSLDTTHPAQAAKQSPRLWLKLPGPNGIAVKDGTMYIVSIPSDYVHVTKDNIIYRINDLAHPEAERFIDAPGLYDGVALSDDGRTLYISDWQTASVTAVDLRTKKTQVLYEEQGIGPADIAQSDGMLFVPDLLGSRVIMMKTR